MVGGVASTVRGLKRVAKRKGKGKEGKLKWAERNGRGRRDGPQKRESERESGYWWLDAIGLSKQNVCFQRRLGVFLDGSRPRPCLLGRFADLRLGKEKRGGFLRGPAF